MAGLTWLHLSDWHEKGKDFDRTIVRDRLIEDIKKRHDLSQDLAEIDFIIFSGDVAFSGQSKEYKVAKKEFFEPILEACDLSSDRLFIVPGNHDLDRTKFEMLPAPLLNPLESSTQAKYWLFDPEKRSEALKPFKAFASFVSRYTHQKNPNYANIRRFKIDGKNIALIGLNSAWMCGRRKNSKDETDDKGATVVGEPQIYDLVEAISESDIKIAVLHHPFDWLADFESSQIMRRLFKRCDFILRGHQHEQQVTVIHSTYGDCIVIPAGACYDRCSYANAYNFVHLDFESGKGIVFLRCWNERDEWREDIDSSPEGKFEFSLSKFIPNNAEPKNLNATKSIIEPVNIIGRDEQINDFSKLISDFDHAQVVCDNVLLISIWGFGGVGKTYLLKKFGEICDSDKWFITGMSIQIPHPEEPLSVFLSRIHRFQNKPDASKFETISNFVASLPSRSALLVDEFQSDDKDFVDSFEWMISQMAIQTNHRYLIITTCRPRPSFRRVQVVHYIGTEQGLPPLTLKETQEYLDLYWKGNPINKYINKIFRVTQGNPKRLNYLYAHHKIYEKVLLHSDSSVLDDEPVIQATWEYIYNTENLRLVADLAAIVGMVSTECPNDIFDQMIENWYELRKSMLDRSLLEQVRPDTYKIHDLLRDYYYKNMRNTDKKQQHQKVGYYYEDDNQPVEALEHYLRAEDKESIRRVYRPAYKIMERNSDYKSIIRLIGKQIDIFGANDEFGVDVVTDRGMSYRILTNYQSALSDFEQALSICNHIDVPENSSKRAKIFWGLGETYRRLDRYEKSLEFYDKGLVIYHIHENKDGMDGIAKSERGKSAVYKMISRYQESIQGYIAAGNLYRRMENLDGQLYCERGIAAVHMLQGFYVQAREGYAHSLKLYRTTKNPRGIAYASWGYAESLRLKGDIETAIETYKDALKLSKKIGDDWSIFYLSLNLSECYRTKRDFKKARGWHNLMKKLKTYQNSSVLQAHYLLATAELQRLEGKTDYELYLKAKKMYQEVPMGLFWGIAHSRIGLGLAELKTLKDEDKGPWKDRMNSIVEYCVEKQLPNEIQTAKRIIEEQNPDELHPLSFP
jgi:tetratricopeptide (TPR) repeat protein/predicted phosphodiesterase